MTLNNRGIWLAASFGQIVAAKITLNVGGVLHLRAILLWRAGQHKGACTLMLIIRRLLFTIPLLIICILFVGCSYSSQEGEEIDHGYIYTVEIDGVDYGMTEEQLQNDQIGKKIGVKPISCHVPECPAPEGEIFYEIKSTEVQEAVAVESYAGDTYYRCVRIK